MCVAGAPWQDGEDHLVLNLQWDTPLKQRVYTHVCRAVSHMQCLEEKKRKWREKGHTWL